MGNKRAREYMLRHAEEIDWERVRTEPRPLSRDAHARGIGMRCLQLVVMPSFEDAAVWEVRRTAEGWVLHRPQVVQSVPEVLLLGINPVHFDSETLAGYYHRITLLTLPIGPDQSGLAGCDGTSYQLACFGDLWSQWRFQWWTRHPTQWQPLVDIANEMIEAFTNAG